MNGITRMDESRVSSDDRMDARSLLNFLGVVTQLMHWSRLTVVKIRESQGTVVVTKLCQLSDCP